MKTIFIRQSLTELSHLLVICFIQQAKKNIKTRGSFHAAFSGGNTPQFFYSLLASPAYMDQLPWNRIHIYLTDERFVPHSHSDSNFGLIHKNLTRHINIPASHIHPIPTELFTPIDAAIDYETTLKKNLPKNRHSHPEFDFSLLGIGEDGHIASLFPDTNILQITDKLVGAEFIEKLNSWRVSITFQMIFNTKYTALLVANPSKANIINMIFHPTANSHLYPALKLVAQPRVNWFFDAATAKKIVF